MRPGRSARMVRHASMPVPSGSRTPIMTTSGSQRDAASIAWARVPASPATAKRGSAVKSAVSPRRTTGCSSTIRTRMCGVVMCSSLRRHLYGDCPKFAWMSTAGPPPSQVHQLRLFCLRRRLAWARACRRMSGICAPRRRGEGQAACELRLPLVPLAATTCQATSWRCPARWTDQHRRSGCASRVHTCTPYGTKCRGSSRPRA